VERRALPLRCKLSSVLCFDLHQRGLRDHVVCGEDVTLLRIHDHAGAGRVNLILELLRNVEELTKEGVMIERIAPPAGDQVGRFLIESKRRVIVHCRKLLDDQNLPTEDHRRLTRLLGRAEARLQDLASQTAVQEENWTKIFFGGP